MTSFPDINETTIDETTKEPSGFFSDRWKGAAPLLALVLFTAAVMKAVPLATVPVLGEGLFHARWFEFCLVEFEFAFGLWLLGGQLPGWTRLAVIALFSLFGLVSLFKALSGGRFCGCFGAAAAMSSSWRFPPMGKSRVFRTILFTSNLRTDTTGISRPQNYCRPRG